MSEISRDRRAPGPLLAALIAVALGGALVAGAIVAAPSRSSTGFECDGIHGRSGSGFYERNPTYVDRSGDASDWARSTPEAEGIDPERLGRGIDRIARNPVVRSVLVVRHDRLVVERYPNGGAANHADNIHSASKSMLQALLGIAIERGLIGDIDDPVASYLPRYFAEASARKRRITIRDLISMSSGLR